MIKLGFKRFFKNPALLVISIIYLLFIAYIFIRKNCYEALDPFIVVMGLGQISFLFFLFVSYEYFCEAKRAKAEEVICVSARGLHWYKTSGVYILLIIDCVVCLLFYFYPFIIILRLGIHNTNYMIFLGVGIVVFHFLVNFLAVLLSMAASYMKSRTKGYCVLLFIYFVTSGHLMLLLQSYSSGNNLTYRLSDLLNLFNREYSMMTDFYYIYSLEGVNFQRILLWISLVMLLLVLIMNTGKKKIVAVIPGVGLVLCTWLFFQPTSAVNLDLTVAGQDAWTYDMSYYQNKVDCMDMSMYKEADFKAVHYQAVFDIQRELSGEVTVTVDKKNLNKYDFTLYHGYQVSDVTTQTGKKLPFIQEGDYISIDNATGGELEQIRFCYKGHCKRYYSTNQGVFLPAYLAYYPMPGRRQVYIVQYGYLGNTIDGLGYEADFDIRLNIKNRIYSNLPVKDGNHICGKSDGITLLCSQFACETRMKDCRIIYPSLDLNVLQSDWGKTNLEKFFSLFEHGLDSLAGKTIIVPPYINGDIYYFGKDHFIGSPGALEMEYERYLQTGELYAFRSEEEIRKELEQIEE